MSGSTMIACNQGTRYSFQRFFDAAEVRSYGSNPVGSGMKSTAYEMSAGSVGILYGKPRYVRPLGRDGHSRCLLAAGLQRVARLERRRAVEQAFAKHPGGFGDMDTTPSTSVSRPRCHAAGKTCGVAGNT